MAINVKDLKSLLAHLPDEALIVWRDVEDDEHNVEPGWFTFDSARRRVILATPYVQAWDPEER